MNLPSLARLHDWLIRLLPRRTLKTDARRVLEQIIFPYFTARDEFRTILFIGCDWYTEHYKDVFHAKEYWTIEKDRGRSERYGAPRRVTDGLHHLTHYFGSDYFDLIICNGVFGWGLDSREEADASLDACLHCLRPGGVFILGWNDVPERRPFAPEECKTLRKFVPYLFPPLTTSHYLTKNTNRHIYDFYAKRNTAPCDSTQEP
jgi:SAM-dependent methyltransferase